MPALNQEETFVSQFLVGSLRISSEGASRNKCLSYWKPYILTPCHWQLIFSFRLPLLPCQSVTANLFMWLPQHLIWVSYVANFVPTLWRNTFPNICSVQYRAKLSKYLQNFISMHDKLEKQMRLFIPSISQLILLSVLQSSSWFSLSVSRP